MMPILPAEHSLNGTCHGRWQHRTQHRWFTCVVHACALQIDHSGRHVCVSCGQSSATLGGPR